MVVVLGRRADRAPRSDCPLTERASQLSFISVRAFGFSALAVEDCKRPSAFSRTLRTAERPADQMRDSSALCLAQFEICAGVSFLGGCAAALRPVRPAIKGFDSDFGSSSVVGLAGRFCVPEVAFCWRLRGAGREAISLETRRQRNRVGRYAAGEVGISDSLVSG